MLRTVAERLKNLRGRRGRAPSDVVDCCIVTRLTLPDRDIDLEGVVLRIGSEEALFREAAIHLFDRSEETVLLAIDGDAFPGRILSTDASGFRIAFDEPIGPERLRDCIMRHGVDRVVVV